MSRAARPQDPSNASQDPGHGQSLSSDQTARIFVLTGRFPALDADAPPPDGDEITDTGAREQGRMLKMLLGSLDGMVYRCRDDEHWTMEFVSDGCFALTGYLPSDLLYNKRISYEQITHPDDRARIRETVGVAVSRRRRYDIEYRLLHANGSIRWVWERGTALCDASGRTIALEGIIQDVTDRRDALQALRHAERRYRSLFDNAVEGIFQTTADGQYLDANPALARIYGFESTEELMSTLRDIRQQLYVDPARREEFMQLIRTRGSVIGFESQIYRKNGDVIWISENARAVFDDDGRMLLFEGTVEDVTERKLYQARMEQQANFDTLTGLANRALLNDRLQQAILSAERHGTQVAVLFVDLDRFKLVNDSLGHISGDALLQVTAGRLKSCVRDCDTVARLGGDEFVLLICGETSDYGVNYVAERVLASVSAPWVTDKGEFNVTCSVGVAVYPDDGRDADAVLRHADSAMYRAKQSGGHTVQFFTAEMNVLMTERLEMESKLRRALEREQFLLHYQPRIDLTSGRVVGAEALIRWQISDTEIVSPARFIPVAEETGLIVSIGRWVLETACAQNKAWQDAGLPPIVVSVNVSARQFRQGSIVDTVAEVLATTGLEARYLEIELTESMVMHDADKLTAMLDQLNNLGVQIAVDDFGTGYSSLSYLKRFPVDRLKVDQSFVQDIMNDADNATIARTIISLGHNLGLKVVAEGVESSEQVEFLRQNNCDEMQGYYFGRPVSHAEFRERHLALKTAT